MPSVQLRCAERADRDDLGAFVSRAVRLDEQAVVRMRSDGTDAGTLRAWMLTPFDVLAGRAVAGWTRPEDATVSGAELLAALSVQRGDVLDAGPPKDLMWRGELPPATGWRLLEELPVEQVARLVRQGVALAQEHTGPKGTPPASLLDQTVLTVSGEGSRTEIPMRCLFALSAFGFAGELATAGAELTGPVRVALTDSWLRLDGRFGAVWRRRHTLLPLLV